MAPLSLLGPLLLNQTVHNEINELVNTIVENIRTRENPIDSFINAIGEGDVAKITAIVSENPRYIDIRFDDESFPLNHAVYRRQTDVVDFLLERGANPRLSDRYGVTPIHAAIAVGSLSIVKKLYNKGGCVEASDKNGETPLFYAFRARDVAATSYLVRKKADVNAVNSMGNTVYHILAQGGYPFAITQILKHAKPTCLANQNYIGDTPLHVATENCNFDFIRKFRVYTPLHVRFSCNYIGFVPEDYIEENNQRYNRIKNLYAQWASVEEEETQEPSANESASSNSTT
jgi:hypothetical protein